MRVVKRHNLAGLDITGEKKLYVEHISSLPEGTELDLAAITDEVLKQHDLKLARKLSRTSWKHPARNTRYAFCRQACEKLWSFYALERAENGKFIRTDVEITNHIRALSTQDKSVHAPVHQNWQLDANGELTTRPDKVLAPEPPTGPQPEPEPETGPQPEPAPEPAPATALNTWLQGLLNREFNVLDIGQGMLALLADKDAELARLAARVSELEGDQEMYEMICSEESTRAQELERINSELRSKLEGSRGNNNVTERELQELEKDYDARGYKIDELARANREKDQLIERLKVRVQHEKNERDREQKLATRREEVMEERIKKLIQTNHDRIQELRHKLHKTEAALEMALEAQEQEPEPEPEPEPPQLCVPDIQRPKGVTTTGFRLIDHLSQEMVEKLTQ